MAEVPWPVWAAIWEDDLAAADHDAIGTLLARCFPRSRTPFGPGRSWASGRPEVRLLARCGSRVVAHLGVLRRFLRVDAAARLVGDVGLVGVDPSRQGTGLGGELLVRGRALLDELGMPFGFLTCGHHVSGFYATGGWAEVTGGTRMVRADGTVQVYGAASMVLPVHAPLAQWPHGRRVDRNGLEL
ncbi:GNAT family N-acetyltransferase [Pseudonocardia sp.]|uniref:GNAT family N-acetyltransferase n=1 Tax=Pseudonocardia sp. TaxID=60912 RepID=UPI003D09657F